MKETQRGSKWLIRHEVGGRQREKACHSIAINLTEPTNSAQLYYPYLMELLKDAPPLFMGPRRSHASRTDFTEKPIQSPLNLARSKLTPTVYTGHVSTVLSLTERSRPRRLFPVQGCSEPRNELACSTNGMPIRVTKNVCTKKSPSYKWPLGGPKLISVTSRLQTPLTYKAHLTWNFQPLHRQCFPINEKLRVEMKYSFVRGIRGGDIFRKFLENNSF